jgi:hypothetical protein
MGFARFRLGILVEAASTGKGVFLLPSGEHIPRRQLIEILGKHRQAVAIRCGP